MKAFAFEWDSTINPPYAGAAVIAAGNVQGARKVLAEEFKAKGLKSETLKDANGSKPGPYWTSVAKGLTKPKVLYFKEA